MKLPRIGGQLEINGETFGVVEDLGVQAGRRACIVKDGPMERTAVLNPFTKTWRFWEVRDRLGLPLTRTAK